MAASDLSHPTFSDEDDGDDMIADPLLVYFDLETTGLSYQHEITQISCVCPSIEGEGSQLNVYMVPRHDFDPMASIITGLTKSGRKLLLRGLPVHTVSLKKGLTLFTKWIAGLPRPPLLVGHNSRKFDSPRLLLALWNNNLLHLLRCSIFGFSDTLPLLRKLLPSGNNYKLQSLVAKYCPSFGSGKAHNALDDCHALEQVLSAVVREAAATTPLLQTPPPSGSLSSSAPCVDERTKRWMSECVMREHFSLQEVVADLRRYHVTDRLMSRSGS